MGFVTTCHKCKDKIIGVAHKYQGALYCDHCYEEIMAEVQRFEEEKQKLIYFIKDLFNVSECPEFVLYAIDRAVKDNKKLSGIKGTLIYYYNIKGNPTDNINMIGTIIQREYNNAAQYYEGVKKIRAVNAEIDINVPPVTVKIHSSPKELRKPKYKMEDL